MEDKLYHLLKLYYKSPSWIKFISGNIYKNIPLSIKYGKKYFKFKKLLDKSQRWTDEKLLDYQWRNLESVLNHAYKNVPYYTKTFDEYGIKPSNIKDFEDFKKVPFLTKKLIRENLNDLTTSGFPKSKMLYVSTGGSTGVPLGLYYQKSVSRAKEAAFINCLLNRIGYKSGDRVAVLRGHIIKDPETNNFSNYEPIKNRLLLSSFHMTEKNLPIYIEEIKKFKPKFLHVYPSALTILAKFIKRNNNEKYFDLKAIIASSEMLYPWQKELFRNVFECKIFSIYGLVELCALAGYCEKNEHYHFFPEYSYVEFIEKQNLIVNRSQSMYEIVGTNFDNYVMPLIRYKTMDYATYIGNDCKCGRNYTYAKKIVGRKQDFFIDKTNSLITFTYADVPFWDVKDKISAYQYIQTEPGIVNLNIEGNNKLENYDINIIKKNLKTIYPSFDFKINTVEQIPKTKNGKFRYLIQNLSIDS
jgi:phenylacetate-CoA ligase